MSVKGSVTKAIVIPFDEVVNFYEKLYENGEYVWAAIVCCGLRIGLKYEGLKTITWEQIIDKKPINIHTKGIIKKYTVPDTVAAFVYKCFLALNHKSNIDKTSKIAISRKNMVYSAQRMNVRLKLLARRYNLPYDIKTQSFLVSYNEYKKSRGEIYTNGEISPFINSIIDNEVTWFVYLHKNIITGLLYFGITSEDCVEDRWDDGGGYRYNNLFYHDIQQYGWDDGFTHTILFKELTGTEALNIEQALICMYDTTNPQYGYNVKGRKKEGISFILKEYVDKCLSVQNIIGTEIKADISKCKYQYSCEKEVQKLGIENKKVKMKKEDYYSMSIQINDLLRREIGTHECDDLIRKCLIDCNELCENVYKKYID